MIKTAEAHQRIQVQVVWGHPRKQILLFCHILLLLILITLLYSVSPNSVKIPNCTTAVEVKAIIYNPVRKTFNNVMTFLKGPSCTTIVKVKENIHNTDMFL